MAKKRRLTREESKAQTRAQLLHAANRLFLRKGFVATSLAEIAEEAALTKGAVYSNFASKEDLFLALLEHGVEDGFADHDRVAPPAPKWRDGTGLQNDLPTLGHMALFLEVTAVAMRNPTTRELVRTHNDAFFDELGRGLAHLFGTTVDDPSTLGFIAQSLYAGMAMHLAFDDGADAAAMFDRAREMLEGLARSLGPR